MQTIDLIVLILYLAAVVGVGAWLSRRNRSSDEFMAAGRSLPGLVVGLSIFGTFVSSISFLANPGKSYDGNWNPFVFGLSLPIAALIATFFFVPFYRREGNISAYHHLEERFGPWARTYAVVCYLLTQLARMGTIMYLVALALEPMTGLSIPALIVITGILVTVYTLLGGIEAVIWTDAIQSVVLTLGILITIAYLMLAIPGGPSTIFTVGKLEGKFSLGSMGPSLAEPTFWVVLVYGLFINLQNFGIDQSYVQRYITAKSDRDAIASVWLGALLYLPISALLFFVGTGLYAFYTLQPEMLPVGVEKGDQVFPAFIVSQLPVGVTGILVAAVLAAAMSSVDSSLNCSASLFLCDLYKRYFRSDASERESMSVLRSATIFFGIAGTSMALAMISVKSALDSWWKLAAVFSGGMLGLFLLGIISRAKNSAAIFGVCVGVVTILWLSLSQTDGWPEALASIKSPFHANLTIVFGTTAILLAGLGAAAGLGKRRDHLKS